MTSIRVMKVYTMNAYIKKCIIISLIIATNIFLWLYFDISNTLTIDFLKNNREILLAMINQHYWLSLSGYIMLYTIDAALFLPLTAILVISGGFLFGIVPAIVCSVIGASIGGTSAFLTSRYVFGSTFQAKFHDHLTKFNKQLEKYDVYYLLFARLVPILPFSLVNILAGLTLTSTYTFFWTTAVGIIPNVIIFAYMGRQLASFNQLSDLFTPQIFGSILLLVLLTIISLFIHYKNHHPSEKAK